MCHIKCTAARFTTAVTGNIAVPAGSAAYSQHQMKHIRDFRGIGFEIYENILIVSSCGGVGDQVGAGMGADKGVAERGE